MVTAFSFFTDMWKLKGSMRALWGRGIVVVWGFGLLLGMCWKKWAQENLCHLRSGGLMPVGGRDFLILSSSVSCNLSAHLSGFIQLSQTVLNQSRQCGMKASAVTFHCDANWGRGFVVARPDTLVNGAWRQTACCLCCHALTFRLCLHHRKVKRCCLAF